MALYATLNENNHICIYPDNEDFLGVQRMEFPLGIHLLNFMYLDIDEINMAYTQVIDLITQNASNTKISMFDYIEMLQDLMAQIDNSCVYMHFYTQMLYEIMSETPTSGVERMDILEKRMPDTTVKNCIYLEHENANKDKKLKTDRYIGIRKLASVIDEKKKERYIKFYHYVREEIIADIKRKRAILKEEIDYIYKKITNSQLEGMSNAQKLYVLDQTRVIENKQDNFYINKPFNVFYRAVPNLDERAEYKTSKDLIDVVKRDSTEIKELYEIKDMNDLIRFELLKFVSSDIEFKECENCHQYFIPVNRKDEIYCNRPIKGTEKICKDVGAMNRHKEKAGDIPGEKEYWRVYKRYKYKADRKIISKSEFNQWNYMALELKQECAEGKITVDDMLQRIEVFENRKKLVKNRKTKK